MLNKKYSKFIILLSVFCFLLSANICCAAIIGEVENCDCNAADNTGDCQKYCEGDYGLNDFVQIFINCYKKILGIVGSLALLMFIYGGFMFLISSGNSEKITQAKQIIVSAVIGLIIVFTSYMIIQFIFTAFDITEAESGKWATPGSWFK